MMDGIDARDALVTVLFADIRDFTPFAHRATAREAVSLLNRFYGLVVPLIAEHGGRPQQFLGDGVLAVFGADEPLPDHADRAVAAAAAIPGAAEGVCEVSVGVNSGLVIVGTIGAGRHSELGVIGDPVNVAARVEAATRATGDAVLITEATRCLLESDHVSLEPRGRITLKGKPEPVEVHALAQVRGTATRNDSQTPAP
jgi:class 3 adenylate cyclase